MNIPVIAALSAVGLVLLIFIILLLGGYFRQRDEICDDHWERKKRKVLFGLPWGFKVYRCSKTALYITDGFLNRTEDEINLYRIRDISYRQSLFQRMFSLGTLDLVTSDRSAGNISLINIKDARKIRDILSEDVEKERLSKRVGTRELMGDMEEAD